MLRSGKNKINSVVVTLGWVSFLTDVASEMIYPLLPAFLTKSLRAGPGALGLVEGVAEATASLTKVLSGWWSDRLSRRKPLVVAGYLVAAIARPLVGVAARWTQVLAIRFADRIGKGVRNPPRDALIAELVPADRRGRAFGLQRAMDNAGALVGPLVAALLLRYVVEEERVVFLLAAIPGLAAVLLLLARVPESPRARRTQAAPASPRRPLPSAFWVAISVFVFFTLANSTDAFLLLRAQQAGVQIWQLPLLWALFHGVKAVAGVPGGALSDRIGRTGAIAIGWGIYTLSYVGFALVESAPAVWGLFCFYALFAAFTEGAERALIADLVPAGSTGRAFGVFHAGVGLGALPASVLFGLWWSLLGPRIAFLIGAALALAATVGLLLLGGRIKRGAQRDRSGIAT
jgi:MFS family permease